MSNTEKSLMEFVAAMGIKLDSNQAEKGGSWVVRDMCYLLRKLDEKMEEYWAMERDMESASALVDIANFCMMLYHRHVGLQVREAAKTNRRDLQIILRHAKEQMESAMAILDKEGEVTSEEFRLAIHHAKERLNAVDIISHKGDKL